MRDLNYFPLTVESNIYGMTTLEFDDGSSKLLVATTDCQIYCINYSKFKPQTREVEFTYIPSGARIISIGALKRGVNDFAIGITHSLVSSMQKSSSRSGSGFPNRDLNADHVRSTTYYFNIYASASASSGFDLDHVAQGCQTIRLRYTPYHLYQTHTYSFDGDLLESKPFWLLSGGDNSIHAFCEDKTCQNFAEIPIGECFPELAHFNGLALWIDVKNIQPTDNETDFYRVIALGLEDGSVKLFKSVLRLGSDRFQLVKESSFESYTTIVPSVRLFKVCSTSSQSDLRMKLQAHQTLQESDDPTHDLLCLLVVSSTNPCLIFKDVLNHGLEKKYELPGSQRLDATVTSAIGDVNLDGHNELLLGTHGRELLTYQYDRHSELYYLKDVQELNSPLYSMSLLHLTGDSLKELTILLASGILVMKVSVGDVINLCKKRVESLLALIK